MRWKRRNQEDAAAENEDRIKMFDTTGICTGGCCYLLPFKTQQRENP